MSFSFNFALAGDGISTVAATEPCNTEETVSPATAAVHHTRHGERFHWQPEASQHATMAFVPVVIPMGTGSPLQFEIVNASDASFVARTGAISSILTTSDLQAGVYEGGFKLWECAVDLVQYMASHERFQNLSGQSVAELGCGHGLPGIYALLHGATHVAFMDYNKEVLELTTCPNVARNLRGGAEGQMACASFYAGAWGSVSELMQTEEQLPTEQQQFDLILTAETVYTEAVAVELYETIRRHLRRAPGAVALVAAKKYYFGTGGSVQHFVELVHRGGEFRAETVWQENDGRSNMRAILRVTPML